MDKGIFFKQRPDFVNIGRSLIAKAILTILVLFESYASFADVVPPKNEKIDTVAKAGGYQNMGQTPDESVEMATGMRSSGKIYVVVAVMTMILVGLYAYVFSLDKKITRLEKDDMKA